MECIDIPVDHRLVDIIKHMDIPKYNNKSTHLDILRRWGESLYHIQESGEKTPMPNTKLHHAVELAKPATKGGVLVALLEPPQSQTFEEGFTADLHSCRTTSAVSDLIETATGGQLSVDDVSIFDMLPYCPDGTNDETLKQAQSVFCEMVQAKKPDVVLCCYRNRSGIGCELLVRRLDSQGVGKIFETPHFVLEDRFVTQRVNAFHPSYAVNMQPTYSCFRRLLLAEFVRAFSLVSGEDIREGWLANLRKDCRMLASRLGKSEPYRIDRSHWEDILKNLDTSLSSLACFNRVVSISEVALYGLSWLCADASLFLTKVKKLKQEGRANMTEGVRFIEKTIQEYFRGWCEKTFAQNISSIQLLENQNTADPRGFFDPKALSNEPRLPDNSSLTRDLHMHFLAFLVDLNYSFLWKPHPWYSVDIGALRDAFKRFAANLERTAGRHDISLSESLGELAV
ncbi:hypothetical protein BJX70DRAFT_400966 [Aspergillus crustosus]